MPDPADPLPLPITDAFYTAYVQCCGNWVPYPTRNHDTSCGVCGTIFTVRPPEETEQ